MPHYKEVQREIVLNRFPEGLMQHLMLLSSPGNIFCCWNMLTAAWGGCSSTCPALSCHWINCSQMKLGKAPNAPFLFPSILIPQPQYLAIIFVYCGPSFLLLPFLACSLCSATGRAQGTLPQGSKATARGWTCCCCCCKTWAQSLMLCSFLARDYSFQRSWFEPI